MLIKDCIYFLSILISLFSVISLGYSVENKNKCICNWIILIDIIYALSFLVNYIIMDALRVEIGMEILIIWLIEVIAGILYVVSIVLNLIKRKKLTYTKNNKVIFVAMILVLFPTVLLSTYIVGNKLLINNSDLILVYESGDGLGRETFAYAIGKDFCKQFDLGISLDGYDLERFLPSNATEINAYKEYKEGVHEEIFNINDLDADYKIVFNTTYDNPGYVDSSISVYKDGEKIYKVRNKSHYFNIDFEKGIYIKH